jgi:CHAD domain-containing protein
LKQGDSKRSQADLATCVYGAGVLLRHVNALGEEIQGVHAGEEDIEFIHRARVASRRLRAALPLFPDSLPSKKSELWLKHIRNVTRALGEARDTDVQLERLDNFYQKLSEDRLKPGVNRLKLRLRQKRLKLQAPVTRAMANLIKSGVIEAMQETFTSLAEQSSTVYMFTPALYQHSFQSISQRLEELLAYDEIVTQREKVTELHEMRIRAKWLRYTMENFAPLYSNELKPFLQAIRKTQEMVGDVHDADVWQNFLPQFLEEERQRTIDYFGHGRSFNRLVPGIQSFQQDCQQARDEIYTSFVNCWQEWQQEALWDSLRKTIQVPFPQPEQVFPPPIPRAPIS